MCTLAGVARAGVVTRQSTRVATNVDGRRVQAAPLRGRTWPAGDGMWPRRSSRLLRRVFQCVAPSSSQPRDAAVCIVPPPARCVAPSCRPFARPLRPQPTFLCDSASLSTTTLGSLPAGQTTVATDKAQPAQARANGVAHLQRGASGSVHEPTFSRYLAPLEDPLVRTPIQLHVLVTLPVDNPTRSSLNLGQTSMVLRLFEKDLMKAAIGGENGRCRTAVAPLSKCRPAIPYTSKLISEP